MRLDFGLWRPHENRVSKTRFIILINTKEEPRPRRTQRKKKKTETEREEPRPRTMHDPGQAACIVRDPGQAARTVRDPGQAARCAATQAYRFRQRAI